MNTVDRLRRIVAEVLDIPTDHIRPEDRISSLTEQTGQRGDLSGDASLIGDLGADSLNVIEIIMAIEQEFALKNVGFRFRAYPAKGYDHFADGRLHRQSAKKWRR